MQVWNKPNRRTYTQKTDFKRGVAPEFAEEPRKGWRSLDFEKVLEEGEEEGQARDEARLLQAFLARVGAGRDA